MNNNIQAVSIIIPVFNEVSTIKALLMAVQNADTCGLKKEIIVVDDGSTDGTRDILKKFNVVKVIFHDYNQGKGAAIRTGMKHATGDIILIQDADLEYNPSEYPLLLQPILDKKASVVYGSRFSHGRSFHKNMYYSHAIGNFLLSACTSILYFSKIEDMETGYKVMKKDVALSLNLKSSRFDIEPEITAKILKKGISIHEVPITFQPRSFHEGKKISWKDGLIALWTLIKWRLKN
jgi:glycosyltransferase involved in cell wall biosynthesis